ncbi:MAG: elongation factor P [Candidatus Tectomicrobia bacterium]|uniref:Elongation factor P n=1 Tax=Tectimicrobiota bacterium TaxID=2528274 RepID=A0A932CPA1_UNCTE|nr:elongation factor P [Candidatus Tectomicrobia bacterium]
MAYVQATQLRVGMIVNFRGELYQVTYTHHLTPGNKRGQIQTKLKNLKTGTQIDHRFRSEDDVEKATLEGREMEYLYNNDSEYVFMDTQSYEQLSLNADALSDLVSYLVPNTRLLVQFYEGKPMGIEMPAAVELKVVATEPGLKRATATASMKPATVETGAVVQVPQFIEVGEVIRVDPSTGKYMERAK